MCRTWLNLLGWLSALTTISVINKQTAVVTKSTPLQCCLFSSEKGMLMFASIQSDKHVYLQLLSCPYRLTLWKGLVLVLFRPGTMHLDRRIHVQYEMDSFQLSHKTAVVTTNLMVSAFPGQVTVLAPSSS
jgi:hypothetical protein